MKTKKIFAAIVIVCALASAQANATGGGKLPPPNGKDKVAVMWYQPILDLFKF